MTTTKTCETKPNETKAWFGLPFYAISIKWPYLQKS